MNYIDLLITHSYYRWLVLLLLFIQFVWIWRHKNLNSIYTSTHFKIHLFITSLINIQLLIGWILFFNSPLAMGFWEQLPSSLKHRQFRFFGLEHMSMMSLGIFLSNIYCFKAYQYIGTKYFKKLWIPYLWIYFILLSSIPWSFSPLTSRPNFR